MRCAPVSSYDALQQLVHACVRAKCYMCCYASYRSRRLFVSAIGCTYIHVNLCVCKRYVRSSACCYYSAARVASQGRVWSAAPKAK
mmetsp:Transcript_15060/g.28670  ORF Transcript_15060/g.28670 Transcript_15060/m.28670 type:complete len:86 (-) Transcript_15060:67-324(-)